MNRLVLSDAAWERMAPLIIGRPDQKGSTGREIGCSWKACLGSFVRALPGVICMKHSGIGTVYPSLQSLELKGVWWRISRQCPMIRTSNI